MAAPAPVCSTEKLNTTVFGQLSRKFPFRLSRMATLLTRIKPELFSTIQGGCPDDRPRSSGKTRIFREIQHYLDTGSCPPLPLAEVKRLLCTHVRELHDFYGQAKGTESRVNTSPVSPEHAPDDQFRRTFNAIEDASEQLEALEAYFENFA